MDEKQNDEFEELQIVEDPDYNPPPPIEDYPRWRDEKRPRSIGMVLLGCLMWVVLILLIVYGIAILITIFENINKAAPLLGMVIAVICGVCLISQFQRKH